MKKLPHHLLGIAVLSAVLNAGTVLAHGGEDHGPAAAAASSATLPRASASTSDFELVAVLEGNRVLIHVDRTASNEPVIQARVEVDGAGPSAVAPEIAPGSYALDLAQAPAAGSHPLTFTIESADTSDLLTATLHVSAVVPADETAQTTSAAFVQRLAELDWRWLAGGSGLLSAAFALSFVARRQTARRP